MKKKCLILIITSASFIIEAGAQNWIWSKQIGGSAGESADLVCIDANNNVYTTGVFGSNPCPFGATSVIPNGSGDIFITKHDASGNFIWAKTFGGNNTPMQSERINSINYNTLTNTLFISGNIYGTAILGNDTIYGMPAGFLTELDLSGTFLWTKRYPPIGCCTIDNVGNIYVQHAFSNMSMIDTVVVVPGVYLTKYSQSGSLIWVKKITNYIGPSTGFEAFFAEIKVKNDKIFGIGACSVSAFTIDAVSVTANFPNGQYIIGCLDTSGTALWVKACSGPVSGGYAIAVDTHKNTYISGAFHNSAIFGNDTLYSTSIQDLFLAKYDSLGNYKWSGQTYTSNYSVGVDLAMDNDGNFYLTGVLRGNAAFGNFNITSTAAPYGDMFLARFDTSGNCVGIRHLGEANGTGVAVDGNNDIYITGYFFNSVNFDSNPTLTSAGANDVYIAKSSTITGIGGREINPNNQLIIYANPTQGKCNITVPNDFVNEKNLTLSIYDNTGKLIQQKILEMNDGKIKVSLEEEAKGVYNVTLANKKKSYSGKIVFE
ncbi:MAG TPA: T9SS type A sorting domain-containing protein [Bacteroidia bacterium]|nr:T9SS type A sorting domain-containing protein [Bacteroidia bacterium]HNU33913.1 T9SS type A sorting domain-containing protein [Bacteroidia bacterium]